MSMRLIDGRALSRDILASVRNKISDGGLTPGLGVILVGADPASQLYVSVKEKACRDAGIYFVKRALDAHAPELEVLTHVARLNAAPDIHGIVVQLPLPAPLDEHRIIEAIEPRKDADGFHPQNIRDLEAGQPTIIPGLTKATLRLLESTGVDLRGKRAVILANSAVFGDPTVVVLSRAGLTAQFVTPAEPYRDLTRTADILIVAIGKPRHIQAQDVKPGAIVIDIGTTREGDKVVGDVDADSVKRVAGWLTPVPGGVGPVTVAALLENVVELAARRR